MLEALLQLLNGQRPERIVWTADITYWLAGRQQASAAQGQWNTEDGYSSDNSASLYDEYMAGGHRRRIERLHAAGVKCAVHLDGRVRGLLPKLVRSGFDTVEALTPKPAGDLELAAIRDLAGSDTLILWGGVPGIMFAPPYTWPQMESHVRRLVECWGDRPFILGVADQVPPDGDIEFCRKIAQLIQSKPEA